MPQAPGQQERARSAHGLDARARRRFLRFMAHAGNVQAAAAAVGACPLSQARAELYADRFQALAAGSGTDFDAAARGPALLFYNRFVRVLDLAFTDGLYARVTPEVLIHPRRRDALLHPAWASRCDPAHCLANVMRCAPAAGERRRVVAQVLELHRAGRLPSPLHPSADDNLWLGAAADKAPALAALLHTAAAAAGRLASSRAKGLALEMLARAA